MQSMKAKATSRQSKILSLLLSAALLLSMLVVPCQQAEAQDLSLKGDETKSTILASVMFTKAKGGESVDDIALTLDELSKYPAPGKSNSAYGRLTAYDMNQQPYQGAGKEAADYIRALYQYSWICNVPKSDASNPIGWLMGAWTEGQQSIEVALFDGMLRGAQFGAMMYDGAMGFVKMWQGVVESLNIPTLFGLTSESPAEGNLVSDLFGSLVSNAGFSKDVIKVIALLTGAFVAAMFILVAMSAFAGSRGVDRRRLSKTKVWGIRVATIGLTIPLVILLTSTLNSFNDQIDTTISDNVEALNNSIVVDTLKFASTTNLTLPTGWEPTSSNILDLNKEIAYRSSRAWPDKEHEDPNKIASASDVLDKLISRRQVSVADYFSDISSAAPGTIAANSGTGPNILVQGYYHVTNGEEGDQNISGASFGPQFLVPKDEFSSFESTSDIDRQIDYYKVSDGDEAVEGPIKESSKYSTIQVEIAKPETYIYGAVGAGNLNGSFLVHDNFIDADRSNQRLDPNTGKPPTDENDKAVMARNSLMIALLNKYAGTGTSVNHNATFSTQSTAILLQSYLDGGDTLNYKGYQTVANEGGAAKNTGKNGNTFVRYTMPNDGDLDVIMKAGRLNVTWLTGGIAAVIALIALLKAPIFSAFWNATKGMFKALFTGDIFGLLEYVAYYSAIKLSFIFVSGAVAGGVSLGRIFTGLFDNGAIAGAVSVTPLGQGVFLMAVALAFGFILSWPMINMQVGGKPRKLSLIAAIVMIPYLVAESMCASFDMYRSRLYGTSSGGLFATAKRNTSVMTAAEHKAHAKEKVEKVGKAAVVAGTTAAAIGTGGLTAAAGAAARGSLHKAGADVAGNMAKTALNRNAIGDSKQALADHLANGGTKKGFVKDALMAGIDDKAKALGEGQPQLGPDGKPIKGLNEANGVNDVIDAKNQESRGKDFMAKSMAVDNLTAKSISLDDSVKAAVDQSSVAQIEAGTQKAIDDKAAASEARFAQQNANTPSAPIDMRMSDGNAVPIDANGPIDVKPVDASSSADVAKLAEDKQANSMARSNDTAGPAVNARVDGGTVRAEVDKPVNAEVVQAEPLKIGEVPRIENATSLGSQQQSVIQVKGDSATVHNLQQAQQFIQQTETTVTNDNRQTIDNSQTTTTHHQEVMPAAQYGSAPVSGSVGDSGLRDEIRRGMREVEKSTGYAVDDAVSRETDKSVRRHLTINKRRNEDN